MILLFLELDRVLKNETLVNWIKLFIYVYRLKLSLIQASAFIQTETMFYYCWLISLQDIIWLAILTPESNAPIAPTPEKIPEELAAVPESKAVGDKADTPKSPSRKDGKKKKESPSPTRKGSKVTGKHFPF